MRQFVYETEDDENYETTLKKCEEDYHTKIVYRKQKPLKIINELTKVRVVNNKLKKTAVSQIILYTDVYSYNVRIITWKLFQRFKQTTNDAGRFVNDTCTRQQRTVKTARNHQQHEAV